MFLDDIIYGYRKDSKSRISLKVHSTPIGNQNVAGGTVIVVLVGWLLFVDCFYDR